MPAVIDASDEIRTTHHDHRSRCETCKCDVDVQAGPFHAALIQENNFMQWFCSQRCFKIWTLDRAENVAW